MPDFSPDEADAIGFIAPLDDAKKLGRNAKQIADSGNYAEAIPLFEEVLRLHRKFLTPDHPQLASSLTNLAICYQKRAT